MTDTARRLAARIARASPAWRAAIATHQAAARGAAQQGATPAGHDGFALVREGWLLHQAGSTLAAGADLSLRLLMGDWCYAAGLCDIAQSGDLDAVAELADLIADASAMVAEGASHDDLERRWAPTIASRISVSATSPTQECPA